MKKIVLALMLTIAGVSMASPYKVTVPMSADDNGAIVYLRNYDTGLDFDSVLVEDNKAVFKGDIDDAVMARLIVDGAPAGSFFVENGSVVYDPKTRKAVGSPLNDVFNDLMAQSQKLSQEFAATNDEAKKASIYQQYQKLQDAVFEDNKENALGYYIFIDQAYSMSPEELEVALNQYPQFKKYTRIQKLIKANENKNATSVGKKFVDFEVEYDGKVQRLSDVVGKGKPVLVDFWASWCGPCIRETATLKEIYNKYSRDQLDVLGVAVWDEPDNTLQAIERHQLPWPSFINAQSIPTDLYGISGIPCIILFAGDGTILVRDLQGADLKNAVDAALAR